MASTYRDWLMLERAMTRPSAAVALGDNGQSITPERWNRSVGRRGIDDPNIRQRSGYVGDALYGWVTDAEVNAYDKTLKQLHADVSYANQAPGKYPEALEAVDNNLEALVAEWNVWVQNNSWLTDRLVADADMASFRRRYSDLRGYASRLGVKTSTPEGAPGGGFSLPWWAIPVGLAAIAVVFVGPALAPVVASMLAKKAAVKALVAV